MNPTLVSIQKKLEALIVQIRSVIPNDDPFGNAHNHWAFPGLNKSELIAEAQSIIDLISDRGTDSLNGNEPLIHDYIRRLQHLEQQTLPNIWGNAGQAVPAYLFTLNGLRKALEPILNNDGHADTVVQLRKLTRSLRGMEAQLIGLEPRTASLASMVERIENAYNSADQLPTDLEALAEARKQIADLAQKAMKDQLSLSRIQESAEALDDQLKSSHHEAKSVLERCETAYSAATSVGLAAAFSERSKKLSWSLWVWVGGLIIALSIGSYYGSGQLRALTDMIKTQNTPTSLISLNIILSLLSIGAPIWFAWLATKQIGQRFRLSEDYAFKASISRAYEGYRREAARIDKDLEARLLASALARLDELPLRLVETHTHGSPWHELASSDVVKQAINTVPGFAEQVKQIAVKGVGAFSASKSKPISEAQTPPKDE